MERNQPMNSKFLSSKPKGKDLLDGKSQERIASAIKNHMISMDALPPTADSMELRKRMPRIIGLEGNWGSGKSNVILQLEENLGKDYFFFTYDAWGNQEDLQRRSILELLTQKLLDKDKLQGKTKIRILNSDLDAEPEEQTCGWKKRLFTLVARKSTTHNVTIPKLESGTKAFALTLVAWGVCVSLLNAIKTNNMPCWYPLAAFIASFVPFLIFWSLKKSRGWEWKRIWAMYQTSGKTDTTSYTISELEPSVREFREWMSDLSKALPTGEKLVMVFDNMDRLPKDKVRQLWSSIQTFFAEHDYGNVWCVIPFDRAHLGNAFNDDKELANLFIEKTFPIVYRVPDPIVKDYRSIFEQLFTEAFGYKEEQDIINRAYRHKYSNPNMRQIISFINKMVSLNHIWDDEIRLSSIALFIMNEDLILNNKDNAVEQVIVNGMYADGLTDFYDVKENLLTTEISALVYGVSKADAEQLPMKIMLGRLFRDPQVHNLHNYAKTVANFYDILDEEVASLEVAYLNNAINDIETINQEELDDREKVKLDRIWERLGKTYLKQQNTEESFRQEVKCLIKNNKVLAKDIANSAISRFVAHDKGHAGNEYYIIYEEFSNYMKFQDIDLKLPEVSLDSKGYLAYLDASLGNYKAYPISCNKELLVADMSQWIKTTEVKFLDQLEMLVTDPEFDFTELLKAARKSLEVDMDATSDNIGTILNVCKILTKDEPLNLELNKSFIDRLEPEDDIKGDLFLLKALIGEKVVVKDDAMLVYMALIQPKYISTGTLWDAVINNDSELLGNVLKIQIEKNVYDRYPISKEDVIGDLAKIKSLTGLAEEQILEYLDDWGRKSLTEKEVGLDFASVLSSIKWIEAAEKLKNKLSISILNKYYKDLENVDSKEFFDSNKHWKVNSYWSKVLKILLNDDTFKKHHSNKAVELANSLIENIGSGLITAASTDSDMQKSLLQWVSFSEVSSAIDAFMTKLMGGSLTIDEYKFTELHHYLEQTKGYEAVMLNKVLVKLANKTNVQQIMLDNENYYVQLIQKHIEHSSDLKRLLLNIHNDEKSINTEFKRLIENTGIVEKDEKKEEDKLEN